MGSLSLAHWAIVCVAALLLFGRGRFSSAMGDIGQGLRRFRQGLADDDRPAVEDAAR